MANNCDAKQAAFNAKTKPYMDGLGRLMNAKVVMDGDWRILGKHGNVDVDHDFYTVYVDGGTSRGLSALIRNPPNGLERRRWGDTEMTFAVDITKCTRQIARYIRKAIGARKLPAITAEESQKRAERARELRLKTSKSGVSGPKLG